MRFQWTVRKVCLANLYALKITGVVDLANNYVWLIGLNGRQCKYGNQVEAARKYVRLIGNSL